MNETPAHWDSDPYDYTGIPTDWGKLYGPMLKHIEEKPELTPAEVEKLKAELHALQAASRDDSTDADLADFARRIGFIPPNQ